MDGFQFADRAVENQFADAFEVRIGVTLGAMLGGELHFVLQVIRAHRAGFFHADAERFFAIYVHASVHGPIGDECVVMIGGADDDRLDVLLIEQPPPIRIGFRFGKDLERFLGAEIVDVAQGHDVFVANDIVVRGSPPPHADQSNVQFVAGRVLAEQRTAFENG